MDQNKQFTRSTRIFLGLKYVFSCFKQTPSNFAAILELWTKVMLGPSLSSDELIRFFDYAISYKSFFPDFVYPTCFLFKN